MLFFNRFCWAVFIFFPIYLLGVQQNAWAQVDRFRLSDDLIYEKNYTKTAAQPIVLSPPKGVPEAVEYDSSVEVFSFEGEPVAASAGTIQLKKPLSMRQPVSVKEVVPPVTAIVNSDTIYSSPVLTKPRVAESAVYAEVEQRKEPAVAGDGYEHSKRMDKLGRSSKEDISKSPGFFTKAGEVRALPPASALSSPFSSIDGGVDTESMPVDLSADDLIHDDEKQLIRAVGNVELVQGDRILRADEVSYNLQKDVIIAHGNVVLTEPAGDVHFLDKVQLQDDMRNGFVIGLQSYLAGGGRFVAKEGKRIDGSKIVMRDAAYTPCECADDEDGNPAWQIKAEELTYDQDENKISYKNAKFEFFGVPLFYTPVLSHPDGQVKRKSGFLAPQLGFDSELGATLIENYYIDLAPNRDLTVGTMLSTDELPVALAEYRHRFEDAEMILEGSTTYSSRTDSVAGEDLGTDEEFRGHLFAESLWNINNKWRAGLDLELTTDDQYLRQYDFTSEDVLENELYLERFSGRNYAVGRLLAFQDIRIREEQTDQPNILPEIQASFVGEPNAMLGGRWSFDASTLALQRSSGQDVARGVAEAGWQKRYVSDFGLVNTMDLSVRGDVYKATDRDIAVAGSGLSSDTTETRFFPQAHLVSAYPLVKPYKKMQAVIKPIAAVTVSSDVNSDDEDIPNEDSQDVQIDVSNLFARNRFPGLDRIEDRNRVTYGVQTGLYGYGGSYAEAFLGQSYRFEDEDNPFPEGSGLSRQESDIVGQISTYYDNRYGLDYRFQLGASDLTSQRHELDAFGKWGKLDLDMRYLFAKALEGTDIVDSREQIESAAGIFLTDKWRLRTSALYDLGADQGLREAFVGLDYFGCCMSFSIGAERTLTSDSSGDSGTEITFRLGLKGLGEFAASDGRDWQAGNRRYD